MASYSHPRRWFRHRQRIHDLSLSLSAAYAWRRRAIPYDPVLHARVRFARCALSHSNPKPALALVAQLESSARTLHALPPAH